MHDWIPERELNLKPDHKFLQYPPCYESLYNYHLKPVYMPKNHFTFLYTHYFFFVA